MTTKTTKTTAPKLTAKQAEVMHHYSDRVGETFDVLCGYLTNAVNPEFRPFRYAARRRYTFLLRFSLASTTRLADAANC